MSFRTLHGSISSVLTAESREWSWADVILILLAGVVIIGAGIGLRDPWPADEPRFASIARDMVESGEWFFPRVGGVYYPDKPPVYFWVSAFFYSITDSTKVSFLLPSLFAGLGVLVLIYDLGRQLWARGVGATAALLLLFTFQFTSSAKAAQIDMLLCFWVTLSLYGLVRHLLLGPTWQWCFVGFIAAGLGVITKGVGFLPLFVFIPYAAALIFDRNIKTPGWNWKWFLGPLLLLGIVSLWVVPMLGYVERSSDVALEAYRENILFKQTGGRYLQAWDHREPFWYFFTNVIPFLWLPVSLLLPWLVPIWIKAIREHDQRVLLLLGWVICVLLFFSFASGKRGVYVLPALPVVVLITAPYLRSLICRVTVRRVCFLSLLLIGLGCGAAVFYYTILNSEEGVKLVEKHGITPWWPLTVVAIFALFSCLANRIRHSFLGWLVFLSGLWLINSLWVYPIANGVRSGSELVRQLNQRLTADQEFGMVNWKEQFLLYLDRPVTHFGFRRWQEQPVEISRGQIVSPETLEAINWLSSNSNRRVLVPDQALQGCFIREKIELVGYAHRQSWFIADFADTEPECRVQLASITSFRYDPEKGQLID